MINPFHNLPAFREYCQFIVDHYHIEKLNEEQQAQFEKLIEAVQKEEENI